MASFDDDFVMTFADLMRILKRSSRQIILVTLFFALLAGYYVLSRPVVYQAEASFREKGTSQAGMGRSITDLLMGSAPGTQESSAMSLMKTRRVIQGVVEDLGMQVAITDRRKHEGRLGRVWNNLKTEYAHFKSRGIPLFEDQYPCITCPSVRYDGEITQFLELEFTSEDTYLITSRDGLISKEGRFGELFVAPTFEMILNRASPAELTGLKFDISIYSIANLSDNLRNAIKIAPDKNDKSLLKILYRHPDRQFGAKFLNGLMMSYKRYLQDDHDTNAGLQLAYLENRQQQMFKQQTVFMEQYTHNLSDDLYATGLADVEKEMEFLMNHHHQNLQKLLAIDLSSKRLKTLLDEKLSADPGFLDDHSPTMAHYTATLDELKQQSLSLSLALREHAQQTNPEHESLIIKQVDELNHVHETSIEIQDLIEALTANKEIERDSKLLKDSQFLANIWVKRFEEDQAAYENAPPAKKAQYYEAMEEQKNNGILYLKNLQRLLEVQGKAIQERLTLHYHPQEEFQGISLEVASQFCRELNTESSQVESEMRQNAFVVEQLEDPNTELYSLSSLLKDPFSQELIAKSIPLSMQLRDHQNRTAKEIERIKNELDVQKLFLKSHLEQRMKLLASRQELIREKIYSLQGVSLELVHQKMSIIQRNLQEGMMSKVENLKYERNLIETHLLQLNEQMSRLPKKWMSEQLMKQNLALNKAAVEELTRLIEGKNISHNLEIIQASPVDEAIPPILPKNPRILLFVALGGFLGAFFACVFTLGRSVISGVLASQENLLYAHQRVCGTLTGKKTTGTPLLDQDLDVLRNIMAFGLETMQQPLLLIEGKGPDYSNDLAQLYSEQGLKVVLVPISFDSPTSAQELPGLWQYLKGEAPLPKVVKGKVFDYIATGAISRFSGELISSKKFKDLMQKLFHDYNVVIAVSKASPCTGETNVLLKGFDSAVITITDEKLLDLKPYTDFAKHPELGKRIAFISVQEE